jgi:hypothetical protein
MSAKEIRNPAPHNWTGDTGIIDLLRYHIPFHPWIENFCRVSATIRSHIHQLGKQNPVESRPWHSFIDSVAIW